MITIEGVEQFAKIKDNRDFMQYCDYVFSNAYFDIIIKGLQHEQAVSALVTEGATIDNLRAIAMGIKKVESLFKKYSDKFNKLDK